MKTETVRMQLLNKLQQHTTKCDNQESDEVDTPEQANIMPGNLFLNYDITLCRKAIKTVLYLQLTFVLISFTCSHLQGTLYVFLKIINC